MPATDDAVLPDDSTVTLLATENGAQLFVSGFGLYIGKKGERIVVKKCGKVCAQVPFMRLQEVIIASRGVSFSSDLLEELCARGIRVAVCQFERKADCADHVAAADSDSGDAAAAACGLRNERGAEFCRWIVAGKLHNQEKLLRYFAKSREGAARERSESGGELCGSFGATRWRLKGSACDAVRRTLMGWRERAGGCTGSGSATCCRTSLGFEGRQHQGPGDAVNAALELRLWHPVLACVGRGDECGSGAVCRVSCTWTGAASRRWCWIMVEEFRQPVVDRAILTWLNKGGKLSSGEGDA